MENVTAEIIENTLALDSGSVFDIEAIQNSIMIMNVQIKEAGDIANDFDAMLAAANTLTMAEADKNVKSLKSITDQYESARKSLKKLITEPYNVVEAKGKDAMAVVFDLKKAYEDRRRECQQEIKDQRFADLEREYNEYAPALANVVPLDKIIERSKVGYAASYKHAKMAAEMCEKVDQVARDWQALQNLHLEYQDEAEAEFFRTLSMQSAIAFNDQRIAEQERIEQLKADVEANRLAAESSYEQENQAPEIVDKVQSYIDEVVAASQMARTYVITVVLTEQQRSLMVDYMKDNGIHGRIALGGDQHE